MRLDKHSTILTKYALMGVFLYWAVVNRVYAQEQQTIYHNATSLQSGITTSCSIEKQMNEAFEDYKKSGLNTQQFRNWRDEGSSVEQASAYNKCKVTINKRADEYRPITNSDGEIERWELTSKTRQYYSSAEGFWESAPECPPNPTGSEDPLNQMGNLSDYYKIGPDLENPGAETSRCYAPKELAELDSCESLDGINESHFSRTQGISCVALDDGSQCPVRSSGAIEGATSTMFFYKFDDAVSPTSCYAGTVVDDADSGQTQTDEQGCIGSYCPAPREQYEDENGNVPADCGEINGNFYCTPEKIQEVENRDPTQDPHTPEEPGTEEPGTGEPGTEEPGTGEGTVNLSNIESLLSEIAVTTAGTGDKIGELQQTVEDTFSVTQGAKGKLPTEQESLNEIAQAEQKLQQKIDEVKTYFTTLFSVQSGPGQFSGCYDIVKMKGQTHSACVDQYSDSMNLVSLALLFIFGLISIVILLR